MAAKRQPTIRDEVSTESTQPLPEPTFTAEKVVSPSGVTLIEVTASRGMRVNVGNYEHLDTFSSAKVSITPGVTMAEVLDVLNDAIDAVMIPDLKWYRSIADARKNDKTLAHQIELP